MAIPQVMRWDDKNAPVIDDMRDWAQIQNWFQKIFVTGYLEDDDSTPKPGLGWDVTIDDAGTPKYVYIDSKSGYNGDIHNRLRVRFDFQYQLTNDRCGCQVIAWTHVDEADILGATNVGINYGLTSIHGFNNYENGTHVCPWIVIGTNAGVFFLGGYNHDTPIAMLPKPKRFSSLSNYSSWSYFGDYINDGQDMEKFTQTTSFIDSGVSYITTPSYYASENDKKAFSSTKAFNSTRLIDFTPVYNTEFMGYKESVFSQRTYMGVWSHGMKYPYHDGGLYIVPFELWSYDQGTYMGKIPGLYYPQHTRPLANTFSLIEFDGTGIYSGQHFIGLGRISYDEFYINVTEDWAIG